MFCTPKRCTFSILQPESTTGPFFSIGTEKADDSLQTQGMVLIKGHPCKVSLFSAILSVGERVADSFRLNSQRVRYASGRVLTRPHRRRSSTCLPPRLESTDTPKFVVLFRVPRRNWTLTVTLSQVHLIATDVSHLPSYSLPSSGSLVSRSSNFLYRPLSSTLPQSSLPVLRRAFASLLLCYSATY